MCWHIQDCVQKLPVWKVVINCQILHCTAIHCIALHDFALHCSAQFCTALLCTISLHLFLNTALFSVHWSMLNSGQFWRWWLCLHFNFQFCSVVQANFFALCDVHLALFGVHWSLLKSWPCASWWLWGKDKQVPDLVKLSCSTYLGVTTIGQGWTNLINQLGQLIWRTNLLNVSFQFLTNNSA